MLKSDRDIQPAWCGTSSGSAICKRSWFRLIRLRGPISTSCATGSYEHAWKTAKVFDRLQAGDTLFFDGSHRTFMNSDVTVFFLEVLPRLKPGITVHIHDIYLPVDYPPERAHWYYSEQYMLAASLLAGHAGFEVTLPNHYIAHRLQLAGVLQDLWADQRLAEVPRTGTSFWIETR